MNLFGIVMLKKITNINLRRWKFTSKFFLIGTAVRNIIYDAMNIVHSILKLWFRIIYSHFLTVNFSNYGLIPKPLLKEFILYSSSIIFFSSTFLEFVENEKSEVDTRNSTFLLSVSNWLVKVKIVLFPSLNRNT